MLSPLVLISELLTIDHGKYIVKVTVKQEGITVGTALAAADCIEIAEDRARERALAVVAGEETSSVYQSKSSPVILNQDQKPRALDLGSKETNQKTSSPPKSSETSISGEKHESSPSATTFTPSRAENSPLNLTPSLSEKEGTSISPPQSSSEQDFRLTAPEPHELNDSLEIEESHKSAHTGSPPKSSKRLDQIEMPVDFSDIIAKIDLEMNRLGWTQEQGKQYLLQTYGKKSRHVLSDQELIEFVRYLENL
jgi:hypothetical protein